MNPDSDFVFPKHEAPNGSYIEDEWFMGIMVRATRGKLFGIDRPDTEEELSKEERGLRMRTSKKRSRHNDDDDDDRIVDQNGESDHEREFAKTTGDAVPTKIDEATKGNRPDLVLADAAVADYSQMWKSEVRKGIKADFFRQMAESILAGPLQGQQFHWKRYKESLKSAIKASNDVRKKKENGVVLPIDEGFLDMQALNLVRSAWMAARNMKDARDYIKKSKDAYQKQNGNLKD